MTQRNMSDFFSRPAQALWTLEAGRIERRSAHVPPPGPGEVCVRALASAVSLGTERLVFSGKVPESEWARMRAPFQEGDFPFPVKYGYACVGEIVAGDPDRLGEIVFTLHPHQSLFTLPAEAACPVPTDVPVRRAVLSANMETALNGLWDANASPGDHIAVVGGGVVGLLIARLAARLPATTVTLVDVDPARAEAAAGLGLAFATPDTAPGEQDIVIHASGHAEGLDTALSLAGMEARVVEMSWYGTAPVTAHFGGAFHSRRLTLVSSQVGQLPPARRSRWTYRRRLATALSLLRDPALDALISDPIPFTEAPDTLPAVFQAPSQGQAPLIVYDAATD